jgi:hypothetical protein
MTPAPPNTFADGSEGFAGQLTDIIWKRWLIVSYYIDKYTPPDYQNAVRVGVSIYLFLACFLLLFPTYRKLPKDFIRDSMWEYREVFPFYLFVGVLVGLSGWAFSAAQGSAHSTGAKFLLGVLSIPVFLAGIALILTSIVWVPALLFLLPTWLFWAVSQPFKVAYFLVVKGPVKVLHGLHYLMVPHPLEEVIKKYEEVRARDGAKIDYASFAEKMARGRYNWVRDGIPAWWKSRNWEKRLKKI